LTKYTILINKYEREKMKKPVTIKFENLPQRASISSDEISKIFGGCKTEAFMCYPERNECCVGACKGSLYVPYLHREVGVCVS
jgi:hypothetical protein